MPTTQILLENFRTPNSRVFTGRDRGIDVRQKSEINSLEAIHDKIEIVIPNDIRSINPSFLEEFLNDVVIKLGEKQFNEKFTFTNTGRYDIGPDLEEAIESILREESALA